MFPRPTIIIQLQDGLGNQMFQHARGVALAKRLDATLRFDPSWFSQAPPAGAPVRRYRLDAFALSPAFISPQARTRLLGRTPWRQLNEWNRRRVDQGRAPVGPVLLWDSWKWHRRQLVDGIEPELRRDFAFAAPLESMGPQARSTAVKIRNAASPVMLHVRRGDYVGDALHDVCPPSYYLAAVAEARKQIPQAAFFVFSDDIPWCRQTFAGVDAPMEFHDSTGDEREDLRLMSLCQHHILPNSTFSWWATWLGRRNGQKVFCPDRWFTDEQKSRKTMDELAYPSWTRIPTA